MNMRSPCLLLLVLVLSISSSRAQTALVNGREGSLVFSGGKDSAYTSLVYKDPQGKILRVFQDGISFNYEKSSTDDLSPDKKYFFVNFSEQGDPEESSGQAGESDEYMCAFVHMENGCVETVETGQVCGGKWDSSGSWVGLDGTALGQIDYAKPTAGKLFQQYSAGDRSSTDVTPRVDAYLLEGTTFDNVLACDPVNATNKASYEGLLKLLERDKDELDADKVKQALKSAM